MTIRSKPPFLVKKTAGPPPVGVPRKILRRLPCVEIIFSILSLRPPTVFFSCFSFLLSVFFFYMMKCVQLFVDNRFGRSAQTERIHARWMVCAVDGDATTSSTLNPPNYDLDYFPHYYYNCCVLPNKCTVLLVVQHTSCTALQHTGGIVLATINNKLDEHAGSIIYYGLDV